MKLIASYAALAILSGAVLLSAEPPFWGDEEFVGPFPSWKDVKAHYGAKGDGAADDTAAIQRALDDLQLHRDSCVLYFPAGTYRITDTVKTERKAHQDGMGIAVLGEDPASTSIRWDGKPGGIMFRYDAWYSRIGRLTLDGAGKAGAALAYGPAFSTYNQTADMVFQDAAVGLQMGTADAGQAENAVLRCSFLRCSDAGLSTVNFNSLDIWAWGCRFEDCGWGLYNRAGNFHAYGCLFLRSKRSDIGTANLMVFSFIGNTSIGSRCFLDFSGGHTWGSPCTVAGNRIVEPAGDRAIRLGNGGPYLVLDNAIRARPGAKGPLVDMTWGDQAFVGNRYTVENPVQEAGRCIRLDEKVVDPQEIDAAPPALPGTPPRRPRKVFEVPAGSGAEAIQAAIDEAARLGGERPAVHLPKGTYDIRKTLSIPPGSDLQLLGDAAAETGTVLRWKGEGQGPLLRIEGPSRAAVRDLSIEAGRGTGILADRCDQPGGAVLGDQVNVSGRSPEEKPSAGILVHGIEESDVFLRCLQGGAFCGDWVRVVGGPNLEAGKPAGNQVAVLAGATGTADRHYAVARGGRLVVRSVYHEMSGDAPQAILLDDRGSLAIDSTRFSYKTSAGTPLIRLQGFQGDLALLTSLLLPVDSKHTARIEISGDGSRARALCLGNLFWVNEAGVDADRVWKSDARPPARAALRLSNVNSGVQGATRKGGFDILEDRGETDPAFVLEMLRPLRAARIGPPARPRPGATALSLCRVIVSAGKGGVGVEIRR